ncbi:hypothetical protein, partial [Campylobacter helveticus]|uniref:hypothetical protein n=1 Tax=Campylobacter helveticus TaxID=28898 RepID=UPI0022EB56DC
GVLPPPPPPPAFMRGVFMDFLSYCKLKYLSLLYHIIITTHKLSYIMILFEDLKYLLFKDILWNKLWKKL